MEKVIIKLGGSIITDRNTSCRSNMKNIERICQELKRSLNEKDIQIILIIGSGSYGHQTINEYSLHKGMSNRTQLFGVKKLANDMWRNGEIVSETLSKFDIASYCLHTPSYLVSDNGEIELFLYKSLEYCIKCGFIPIVWGEINFDRSMGFTNVSGDKIAVCLSNEYKPDRVLMFTDVDGVMKGFNTPNSELIETITPKNFEYHLKEVKEPVKIDVNGGMILKYTCMGQIMELGFTGFIGNGNNSNIVYRALVDNNAKGTYFLPNS